MSPGRERPLFPTPLAQARFLAGPRPVRRVVAAPSISRLSGDGSVFDAVGIGFP